MVAVESGMTMTIYIYIEAGQKIFYFWSVFLALLTFLLYPFYRLFAIILTFLYVRQKYILVQCM